MRKSFMLQTLESIHQGLCESSLVDESLHLRDTILTSRIPADIIVCQQCFHLTFNWSIDLLDATGQNPAYVLTFGKGHRLSSAFTKRTWEQVKGMVKSLPWKTAEGRYAMTPEEVFDDIEETLHHSQKD